MFFSIVNQLDATKMVLDDEMQASLLLCSLPDNWETFFVTISNSYSEWCIIYGACERKFVQWRDKNKALCIDPHDRK